MYRCKARCLSDVSAYAIATYGTIVYVDNTIIHGTNRGIIVSIYIYAQYTHICFESIITMYSNFYILHHIYDIYVHT